MNITYRMLNTPNKCTCSGERVFNPLPNDTFLDWSKLEAFAEDKINLTLMQKFFLRLVKNIVGKGENAGYKQFSPFPTMFSKGFFFRVITIWDFVIKS